MLKRYRSVVWLAVCRGAREASTSPTAGSASTDEVRQRMLVRNFMVMTNGANKLGDLKRGGGRA